jgi:hypothetical protein
MVEPDNTEAQATAESSNDVMQACCLTAAAAIGAAIVWIAVAYLFRSRSAPMALAVGAVVGLVMRATAGDFVRGRSVAALLISVGVCIVASIVVAWMLPYLEAAEFFPGARGGLGDYARELVRKDIASTSQSFTLLDLAWCIGGGVLAAVLAVYPPKR